MVANGQTLLNHGKFTGGLWKHTGVTKILWFEVRKCCDGKGFQGYPYAWQSCKASKLLVNSTQKGKQEKNLEFLNSHRKKFDWENEEIDGNDNVKWFLKKMVHPDIISDIPGVELENDYDNTVGPALQL